MNARTLHKVSYGLYIISSINDGKMNGQIANTVFQITNEPKTMAISINKENFTHEFIEKLLFLAIFSNESFSLTPSVEDFINNTLIV